MGLKMMRQTKSSPTKTPLDNFFTTQQALRGFLYCRIVPFKLNGNSSNCIGKLLRNRFRRLPAMRFRQHRVIRPNFHPMQG